MKPRLSHYGLCVSSLALVPMIAFGINSLHAQGKNSAEIVATVDTRANYRIDVTQDLENSLQWTIQLNENEGQNIGDILPGYKVGKIGARTIVAIPKPGKKLAPDQIMRVDQTTGKVLEIFSLTQLLKEQKKEGKK